jgi:hypothetical protein
MMLVAETILFLLAGLCLVFWQISEGKRKAILLAYECASERNCRLTRERDTLREMNRSHTLGALDEDDMTKKLTAAEKKAHELERGNAAFRAANEQLTVELADERVRVGHLDETNRSLKDGLTVRDNLIGELVEEGDEHVARYARLADQARKLIGNRRSAP